MQAEGKKGIDALRVAAWRASDRRKETVYVQAKWSLWPECLARRGPGLPSRLAGPCGGAGTRQPKFLGQDPRGSALALPRLRWPIHNDHVGADPDPALDGILPAISTAPRCLRTLGWSTRWFFQVRLAIQTHQPSCSHDGGRSIDRRRSDHVAGDDTQSDKKPVEKLIRKAIKAGIIWLWKKWL